MRLIKNVETVNPKFPEKYDVVIIDHGQECWIMDDKEDIERFIKASKRVSEHVGEAPDWYILRFIFDHKQVFSIPYDDISYSQEAADIINSYIHNKKRYFHYKEKERGSFADNIDYYLDYLRSDSRRAFIFERELSDSECEKHGLVRP